MWSLKIRSPKDKLREYNIKTGANTLGRKSNNDVHIPDESSSRKHAEIILNDENNTLELIDLGSTNGTYLNGKRVFQLNPLVHEDQIRIGLYLITVLSSDITESKTLPAYISGTSTISMDILIESVEHYAVLLHYIGRQLNNVLDLDTALVEVAELIERMMGSDHCRVITSDRFDSLNDLGIPNNVGQRVIEQNQATIITKVQEDPFINKDGILKDVHSLMCVPVTIDKKVVGIIYVHKDQSDSHPFDKRDFQLVVAISHQVALTIQRKDAEKELLHNANHDSLTDLPNRVLFLNRLWQAISHAEQDPEYLFAVQFIDLDNFKVVNDSLGHIIGDKLLVAAAKRIHTSFNSQGTTSNLGVVARFGGDEFAVLLENIIDEDDAINMAEEIQNSLIKPFNIDGHEIISTASIGITFSSMGYQQPEDILRDADIAMYRAKELGRARNVVYDEQLRSRISNRLKIQTGLRKAVTQEELRLHYQPIITLKTGQVAGFEALIRWESPEHGMLYPDAFMNKKDTTGLLNSIDHWVLQNAIRQMTKWDFIKEDDSLFLAVNLSNKQIKHPLLVDQVYDILTETGLNPSNLWLELTESASIENSEATLLMLSKLRDLQVKLCLDDFGTGFSSLSYLHRFPLNSLKIDRSFINRIGSKTEASKIIQTIVTLAENLKLSVVAEGIEKLEQLVFLRTLNCKYAQGFYFAKPMSSDSVEDFMRTHPQW